MANRITSIRLSGKQLGTKIKATVKGERDINVGGQKVPCRIYVASSAVHPDFEIIVPGLRNSIRFEGRQTVEVEGAELRVAVKRNNVGTSSRSLDLQVYATKLVVLEG